MSEEQASQPEPEQKPDQPTVTNHVRVYSPREIKDLKQEDLDLERVKATIIWLGQTVQQVAASAKRAEVLLAQAAKFAQSKGAAMIIPSIPLHPKGRLEVAKEPAHTAVRWTEPGPGIIVANRMPKEAK